MAAAESRAHHPLTRRSVEDDPDGLFKFVAIIGQRQEVSAVVDRQGLAARDLQLARPDGYHPDDGERVGGVARLVGADGCAGRQRLAAGP